MAKDAEKLLIKPLRSPSHPTIKGPQRAAAAALLQRQHAARRLPPSRFFCLKKIIGFFNNTNNKRKKKLYSAATGAAAACCVKSGSGPTFVGGQYLKTARPRMFSAGSGPHTCES